MDLKEVSVEAILYLSLRQGMIPQLVETDNFDLLKT